MRLVLQREVLTDKSTIGSLYIDGEFFCYSLEDKLRDVKIFGETCIPAGTYPVQMTFSNRFQKRLPLLLGVPGFKGIRIHAGNTDKDTNGCILLGKERTHDQINSSKSALDEFLQKFQEPCSIKISNPANGPVAPNSAGAV